MAPDAPRDSARTPAGRRAHWRIVPTCARRCARSSTLRNCSRGRTEAAMTSRVPCVGVRAHLRHREDDSGRSARLGDKATRVRSVFRCVFAGGVGKPGVPGAGVKSQPRAGGGSGGAAQRRECFAGVRDFVRCHESAPIPTSGDSMASLPTGAATAGCCRRRRRERRAGWRSVPSLHHAAGPGRSGDLRPGGVGEVHAPRTKARQGTQLLDAEPRGTDNGAIR